MSQQPSAGGDERARGELAAAFDREARRMGSMATLLNHAVADAIGMHHTDQQCLDLLDWAEPLTPGEIAGHLGLSSGAVTGLIDRLESGGWVERRGDPADRRRVHVYAVHEKGAELWPLYRPLAEAIERYRDELSDDDLAVVVRFLEFANGTIAGSTERIRRRQV